MRVRSVALSLVVTIALVESAAHVFARKNVATRDEWLAAGEYIRGAVREHDLIVAAPSWADPLAREAVGDHISLGAAGRMSTRAYDRLWVLSIRGAHAPEEPRGRSPEETRTFGHVTVSRYPLSRTLAFDFVEHIDQATVERVDHGAARPCPWRANIPIFGGGLGQGPMPPRERFECGPEPWIWVGRTVNEDLDLRPRRCVWQHPSGPEPIRVTFRDVPIGQTIELGADIYYEHERRLEHGPFDVRVHVGDREVLHMTHADGDGFRTLRARSGESESARGDVTIEVTSPDPAMRTVCWSLESITRAE